MLPLTFLAATILGLLVHIVALVLLGALGCGFHIGFVAACVYLRQCGMIDLKGAQRHHDYLHHGGDPPWKK